VQWQGSIHVIFIVSAISTALVEKISQSTYAAGRKAHHSGAAPRSAAKEFIFLVGNLVERVAQYQSSAGPLVPVPSTRRFRACFRIDCKLVELTCVN